MFSNIVLNSAEQSWDIFNRWVIYTTGLDLSIVPSSFEIEKLIIFTYTW